MENIITEEFEKIVDSADVDEIISKELEKYPSEEGWIAMPTVDAGVGGKVKLTITFKKEMKKEMKKSMK